MRLLCECIFPTSSSHLPKSVILLTILLNKNEIKEKNSRKTVKQKKETIFLQVFIGRSKLVAKAKAENCCTSFKAVVDILYSEKAGISPM